MMTSRGCPFNCIFCLNKTLTRRTFRPRSAENVVAEIEWAMDRFRFDDLYIWDDHFSLIRERAEKICRMIIEKKLNIRYFLPDGIRADSVTPEFAALLRESGCAGVSVGFEDANPETFVHIKKGERYEVIVHAIETLRDVGVPVRCSMVIGLPHTTYASTRVAMENMKKLGVHAEWYLATPFPGTEFYDWVTQHGRLIENPLSLRALTFRRVVFDTPEFPKKDRYRAFYQAFAHYSFPEHAFYGKVCNPLTQQRYRFEKYFLSIFSVARYIPERLPSHVFNLARDLVGAVVRRAGSLLKRLWKR
jgi:anaerobic magnesium-protoporphyrin IX monomethyl ester cyclase